MPRSTSPRAAAGTVAGFAVRRLRTALRTPPRRCAPLGRRRVTGRRRRYQVEAARRRAPFTGLARGRRTGAVRLGGRYPTARRARREPVPPAASDAASETVAPARLHSAVAGSGATTSAAPGRSRAVALPGALSPEPAALMRLGSAGADSGGTTPLPGTTRRRGPDPPHPASRRCTGPRRRDPAPLADDPGCGRRPTPESGPRHRPPRPDTGSRRRATARRGHRTRRLAAVLPASLEPDRRHPATRGASPRRLVRHARGRDRHVARHLTGDSPAGAEPPGGGSPFVAGTGRLPLRRPAQLPVVHGLSLGRGGAGRAVSAGGLARRHRHPAVGRSGSPRHRPSGRPRSPGPDASGLGRR